MTVLAANVTDQDTNDPPDAMAGEPRLRRFTTATPPPPPPGDVIISQVYGGGGNSGATLQNDFIELFNRTTPRSALAGWSVQYASAAGPTWQVTPLTGSIPAGR